MSTPSPAAFSSVPGVAWPGSDWPGNVGAESPPTVSVVFSAGDARWAWEAGAPRWAWAAGDPRLAWTFGAARNQ